MLRCLRHNHRLKMQQRLPSLIIALSLGHAILGVGTAAPADLAILKSRFVQPPDDAKIMMRWWWFGPAVTPPELERELQVMKDAGIGGVEIQPVYPLALDDPDDGIRNLPYLSPEFLSAVRFASDKANQLGMRVDITLGSGWPYGGPGTKVLQSAGSLRVERVPVLEGARSVAVPPISEGERLIAAFVGADMITEFVGGRIDIPAGLSGADLLTFYISSRTGQQVKRAAVGAEGFVLDHYDAAAIQDHLRRVADPLLQAFGAHPPHAIFSDSLEVYGSDWTPRFLEEFKTRRGYDLTPYLPVLVSQSEPQSSAVRHDWAKTLTELAEDHYLKPIAEWAHAHGTLFRSQTYGQPPVILSSNAFVDLPEGEHGPSWRRFSAARWASSANHLYGRTITSTETWTWLHSPSFRATPLDLKAEADRHFVEGINQFVGHGWPYSPPSAGEPGWRFYAAAALNEHNPWFPVMPDIALYLQRVSFLMRQGRPINDVAIYVPTDDAWAHLPLGETAVDEEVDRLLGPALVPAVLNAGYNFDFIDDRAMQQTGVRYKLLILPHLERIPLSTLQLLQQYLASGGRVIATRTLPSTAPGLLEQGRDTPRIQELVNSLFKPDSKNARLVPDDDHLAQALIQMTPPDFETGTAAPAIGFMHRKLPYADVYFLANLSNRSVDTRASVAVPSSRGEWWDPFQGTSTAADCQRIGDQVMLPLQLAPYESRVLVFSDDANTKYVRPHKSNRAPIDLTAGWQVHFPSRPGNLTMDHLHSWTDREETRYYSGSATYRRVVELLDFDAKSGESAWLDFGPGTPVEADANPNGMRALLESPVREAAKVSVNGELAGPLWHPPFEIDVTRFLRSGPNEIQILVMNTAMNEMAETSLPDYRLLNLRYGDRFVPQDVSQIHPLPSGIVGPLRLVFR